MRRQRQQALGRAQQHNDALARPRRGVGVGEQRTPPVRVRQRLEQRARREPGAVEPAVVARALEQQAAVDGRPRVDAQQDAIGALEPADIADGGGGAVRVHGGAEPLLHPAHHDALDLRMPGAQPRGHAERDDQRSRERAREQALVARRRPARPQRRRGEQRERRQVQRRLGRDHGRRDDAEQHVARAQVEQRLAARAAAAVAPTQAEKEHRELDPAPLSKELDGEQREQEPRQPLDQQNQGSAKPRLVQDQPGGGEHDHDVAEVGDAPALLQRQLEAPAAPGGQRGQQRERQREPPQPA